MGSFLQAAIASSGNSESSDAEVAARSREAGMGSFEAQRGRLGGENWDSSSCVGPCDRFGGGAFRLGIREWVPSADTAIAVNMKPAATNPISS